MASVTRHTSHQAISIAEIDLDLNEVAVVDLDHLRNAKVRWDDGGVSWTINAQNDGDNISVKVEHSLMPEGDDAKYWVEDFESPFTKATQGNEHFRVQRIRFTATSGDITVVVASASKFQVSTT